MQNQKIPVAEKKATIEKFFATDSVIEKLNAYFAGDKAKMDRFRATMSMLALSKEKEKWSPLSVLGCGLKAAEIGLSVSPSMGLVYFVAYKGELEITIGYKGWQSLLERADKACKAHAVYRCDDFEYIVDGFDERFRFVPNFDERKDSESKWVEENIRGVLVMVKNARTGMVDHRFVARDKLFQLRGSSPAIKKKTFSPWTDYAAEMFMAKAIKYVVSKTAMEPQVARAVEIENQLEIRQNEDQRKRGSLVAEEFRAEQEAEQGEIVNADYSDPQDTLDDFDQSQKEGESE